MEEGKALHFSEVEKYCKGCGERLVLNNTRDIERKNYCSFECRSEHSSSVKQDKVLICSECSCEFISKRSNVCTCRNLKCINARRLRLGYEKLDGNPELYIKYLLQKPSRSNLSFSEVMEMYNRQGGICVLSGIEMTFHKKPYAPKVHTNLSIDKIDSNKEYTIDNIQLVCSIANTMKLTLTMEEFHWWISIIHETIVVSKN